MLARSRSLRAVPPASGPPLTARPTATRQHPPPSTRHPPAWRGTCRLRGPSRRSRAGAGCAGGPAFAPSGVPPSPRPHSRTARCGRGTLRWSLPLRGGRCAPPPRGPAPRAVASLLPARCAEYSRNGRGNGNRSHAPRGRRPLRSGVTRSARDEQPRAHIKSPGSILAAGHASRALGALASLRDSTLDPAARSSKDASHVLNVSARLFVTMALEPAPETWGRH